MSDTLDEYQLAARTLRARLKNKKYREYPMGQEAGHYLRWKRGQITELTYRDYESCLDKLAREFPDLEIAAFEPREGTELLEEFLDKQWGEAAPRTYNKNLSVLKDFFRWAVLKGKLHGDPTTPIVRHKKRDVHRESWDESNILRILARGPSPDQHRRDRIALRLLLRYGLRKGALRDAQFKHFDENRQRLTIFTKGEKIRDLKIASTEFWDDFAKLRLELDASPDHFLMASRKQIWRGYLPDGGSRFDVKFYPEKHLSDHGMHDWWYGCLERAGLVAKGVTHGEKMHKARHSAAERVMDHTGDIHQVKNLLGHSSVATTEVYIGDRSEALNASMEEIDV